ncbi:MAG: biotin--[acetyl-CoA-carboxylase] ligase [Propionibacteriaceae bacterium]
MPRCEPVCCDRLQPLLGGLWRDIRCVEETGSTNADVMAQAHAGAASGLVLIAEHQTAGRGRFSRQWEDTAGSSIAFSVLVRPLVAQLTQLGWLPLLAGLAVRKGITEVTGVELGLKWPNDILVTSGPKPGKLVGILAELAAQPEGPACVVGMGINVAMSEAELPVPTATSLSLSGARCLDKTEIMAAVLRSWEDYYLRWVAGEDLLADYRANCVSLGRRVRVQLDEQSNRGDIAEGTATGVTPAGELIVMLDSGERVILAAGDVIHLR